MENLLLQNWHCITELELPGQGDVMERANCSMFLCLHIHLAHSVSLPSEGDYRVESLWSVCTLLCFIWAAWQDQQAGSQAHFIWTRNLWLCEGRVSPMWQTNGCPGQCHNSKGGSPLKGGCCTQWPPPQDPHCDESETQNQSSNSIWSDFF